MLCWVVAVFLSVLVHEMGHALAIRALGVQPWITLYGMGGLTSHRGGRLPPKTQILVSLAGPAAGFALAADRGGAGQGRAGTRSPFAVGWPDVIVWRFDAFDQPRAVGLGARICCS